MQISEYKQITDGYREENILLRRELRTIVNELQVMLVVVITVMLQLFIAKMVFLCYNRLTWQPGSSNKSFASTLAALSRLV